MNGYLIDPTLRQVTEVQTDGSMESFCALLDVDDVNMTPFDDHHDMWVDDNGLLLQHTHYIILLAPIEYKQGEPYPRLLAGKALLLGRTSTPQGDACTSARVTLDQVRARIAWPNDEEAAADVAHDLLNDGGAIRTSDEQEAVRRLHAITGRIRALVTH